MDRDKEGCEEEGEVEDAEEEDDGADEEEEEEEEVEGSDCDKSTPPDSKLNEVCSLVRG